MAEESGLLALSTAARECSTSSQTSFQGRHARTSKIGLLRDLHLIDMYHARV